MGPDDASSAEMRRLPLDPDTDALALEDETVEWLLAGELSPDQAPPGFAEVAELLAAATAAPTHGELAGQAAVLAELRAVTRARRAPAHVRRAARPPRRRWAGLAAVALVGALVTGSGRRGHRPAPGAGAGRDAEHPGHRWRCGFSRLDDAWSAGIGADDAGRGTRW